MIVLRSPLKMSIKKHKKLFMNCNAHYSKEKKNVSYFLPCGNEFSCLNFSLYLYTVCFKILTFSFFKTY